MFQGDVISALLENEYYFNNICSFCKCILHIFDLSVRRLYVGFIVIIKTAQTIRPTVP